MSRLGAASIGIFAIWFLLSVALGPCVNWGPCLLLITAIITGLGFGVASIIRTRGRTVLGWVGVVLNCLPVWGLVLLYSYLLLTHNG